MAMASDWLGLWDAGEISDEVLADRVGQLIGSRDGARGFFVVSLTSDSPLMDRLPEPLVVEIRHAGAELVDLTARNLAMSTAMGLHHGRAGDAQQQGRSERIRERSSELLRQLQPQLVKQRLDVMLAAATTGSGPDQEFFERWGYDPEQKGAIAAAVLAVAN
jgi:hypothetical protein